MKNIIFFFVLFFCLFSCNNEEEYQGKWTYRYHKSVGKEYDSPQYILIKNDSISLKHPYFTNEHKYSLKIENKNLVFNSWSIPSNVSKNTLSLNSNDFFTKNDSLSKYWNKYKLKINLPQKPHFKNQFLFQEDDYRIFLYFGRRSDNNKYSLLLNDTYGDYNELPSFLYVGCGGRREELIPFVTTYLFFDKDSRMKDIEKVFTTMSLINSQKLKLVNDIKLKFDDSLGLYYNYASITKMIHPFQVNEKYYGTIINQLMPPPPPLIPIISYPFFDDINPKAKFVLIKKDKTYHNDKVINPSDLKTLIKPWIKNNDILFSLYDLRSTYGSFLEMNAIINSVYEEVREEHSKLNFNKPLKDLTRKEVNDIKMEIRMHHIWSYSIPHYNAVVEQENSFFGLKVNKKE